MDLLNSFRDGNDLTLLCWFVAALGLKEPSQPGEIIPFLFHFDNSRFCSIYGFLHCCDCFLGRLAHIQMWYSCNWLGFEVELWWKTTKPATLRSVWSPQGWYWINCRLCNGWVHINYANLLRTKARNLAEFKCNRCFLVNTIPQCQDVNFRPNTLFNSGVVHLKRVPKSSRIPLAENLLPKINDICETSSNIALWCLLLEEVNVSGHHLVQLSTSVFGMVSLRKNRNATENRSRKAS